MDTNLQYFVIIGKTKLKDKFTELLAENGGKGIGNIYGKGSLSPSILAQSFGLDSDNKRVLVFCLVTKENAKNILDILIEKFNFTKPNSGIAFTIPVQGLMV